MPIAIDSAAAKLIPPTLREKPTFMIWLGSLLPFSNSDGAQTQVYWHACARIDLLQTKNWLSPHLFLCGVIPLLKITPRSEWTLRALYRLLLLYLSLIIDEGERLAFFTTWEVIWIPTIEAEGCSALTVWFSPSCFPLPWSGYRRWSWDLSWWTRSKARENTVLGLAHGEESSLDLPSHFFL